MTETIDVEAAIGRLEEGTEEEQREALGTLLNHSEDYPDDIIVHLDLISSFADNEDVNIQSTVAGILATIASHKPSAVVPHSSAVQTLLTSDDPLVLSFATAAAMRITPESPAVLVGSADRLIELLTYKESRDSDQARNTRLRSVSALGDLGEADADLATRLDDPLADRLNDPDSKVRVATIITVTQLGLAHPKAVSTALARLPAQLDDPETCRPAISAYVQFRHEQPTAIVRPDMVAPALKEATTRADLDEEEIQAVSNVRRYIEEMNVGSS